MNVLRWLIKPIPAATIILALLLLAGWLVSVNVAKRREVAEIKQENQQFEIEQDLRLKISDLNEKVMRQLAPLTQVVGETVQKRQNASREEVRQVRAKLELFAEEIKTAESQLDPLEQDAKTRLRGSHLESVLAEIKDQREYFRKLEEHRRKHVAQVDEAFPMANDK
jgi:response regulator RpfG family c-di-GMP phosphodiesterase